MTAILKVSENKTVQKTAKKPDLGTHYTSQKFFFLIITTHNINSNNPQNMYIKLMSRITSVNCDIELHYKVTSVSIIACV